MLFNGGLALCEFMLLSPPVAGKEAISSLKQTHSFFQFMLENRNREIGF